LLGAAGVRHRRELDALDRPQVGHRQPPCAGADDRPAADGQRCFQQFDRLAGPDRLDRDRALGQRDHPEDLETQAPDLHVVARVVHRQLVGDQSADRRHVLLALLPRSLHVQRRLVDAGCDGDVEGGRRGGGGVGRRGGVGGGAVGGAAVGGAGVGHDSAA